MPARHTRPRPSIREAALAAALACALAAFVAVPVALAADDDLTALAPVGSIPDAPAVGSDIADAASAADPTRSAAAAAAGATTPVVIPTGGAPIDVSGTDEELHDRLVEVQTELTREQVELNRRSAVLERAEDGVDTALSAYADRLVVLYDAGALDRLHALMAVHDATDATTRPILVAALVPQDRAIGAALVERAQVEEAAKADLALQEELVASIVARGTALHTEQDRRAGVVSAPAGDDAEPVSADHVFSTGAIPGIGYWGDVSGGGMLGGFSSMTSAALGGLGCTPPDPALHATGQRENGEASWYGPGFDGHGTANGEVYDQEAMTAAHKTLPFGTIVRVYSPATARCAFVRINDRGPYVDGRIIDLSHAAAEAVGLSGVGQVELEVWSDAGPSAA